MRTTTLFVTDIPNNLLESEFVNIFQNSEGFVTARLRADKNGNIVGFVEFADQNSASIAKNKYHAYKPSVSDQGLTIRFSHGVSSKRTRDREGSGYTSFHNADRAPIPIVMPDGITPFYNPFNTNGYPVILMIIIQPSNLYPAEASTTLYVEGLPLDATEREVAHIFRPFTGYQSLRVLRKEAKQNPTRVYNLCFVEFDSKYQATLAMNSLNGYRMDKNDVKGLKISYAKSERKGRLSSPSSSSHVNMDTNNHVTSGSPTQQSSSSHSNNHNDQADLSPQEVSTSMYVPRSHMHHRHQNIFYDNHLPHHHSSELNSCE